MREQHHILMNVFFSYFFLLSYLHKNENFRYVSCHLSMVLEFIFPIKMTKACSFKHNCWLRCICPLWRIHCITENVTKSLSRKTFLHNFIFNRFSKRHLKHTNISGHFFSLALPISLPWFLSHFFLTLQTVDSVHHKEYVNLINVDIYF